MERLQYSVTTRRRNILCLAIPSDYREKGLLIQQCAVFQKTVEERGGGRRRHGEAPSKKTWKRLVLADMKPTGSPLTDTDEDFSSPDAPREVFSSK